MQYAIKNGVVVYERYDGAAMPTIEGAEYLRVPDELAWWFRDAEGGLGVDPRKTMPTGVLAKIERAGILVDLADLDALAVRPLRAVVAGTATQVDRDRLASLEASAQELRGAMDVGV